MPKYLWRVSYTQEGASGLLAQGGSVRRAAITEMVESVGGHVEACYFAFGEDDLFVIGDAPDRCRPPRSPSAPPRPAPRYRTPCRCSRPNRSTTRSPDRSPTHRRPPSRPGAVIRTPRHRKPVENRSDQRVRRSYRAMYELRTCHVAHRDR